MNKLKNKITVEQKKQAIAMRKNRKANREAKRTWAA